MRTVYLGAFLALGLSQVSLADEFTCRDAQRSILNLADDQLDRLEIDDEVLSGLGKFVQSKPSISENKLSTKSYYDQSGTYQQLWCKLKSQEAVTGAIETKAKGPVASCGSLNRLLLEQALLERLVPGDKGTTLAEIGLHVLDDQDFKTGAQWAPSAVSVQRDGDRVDVRASRLHSPTWVPVFGGMNYCKILSGDGAKKLVGEAWSRYQGQGIEASAKVEESSVTWSRGIWGKQSARVYRPAGTREVLDNSKGFYVVSPGAQVPAAAMSGLARRFVGKGYIVFVVEYPWQLALVDRIDGQGNAALNLAWILKHDLTEIHGLDLHGLEGKTIRGFGHSMGGAALAPEVYGKAEDSLFDSLVLYGVAQLMSPEKQKPIQQHPVAVLMGENDRLTKTMIGNFLSEFGLSYVADDFTAQRAPTAQQFVYQQLSGLNHFCIVSDRNVGNGLLKRVDGRGPEALECVDRLVDAIDGLGLF